MKIDSSVKLRGVVVNVLGFSLEDDHVFGVQIASASGPAMQARSVEILGEEIVVAKSSSKMSYE